MGVYGSYWGWNSSPTGGTIVLYQTALTPSVLHPKNATQKKLTIT